MDSTLTAHQPIESAPASAERADACCVPEGRTPDMEPARSMALADRLRALADPTRLRMLDLLAQRPAPLCVCEITEQFDLRQPTISHHIRLLREVGLVEGEKRGVWSYYWATDEGRRSLALVKTLL